MNKMTKTLAAGAAAALLAPAIAFALPTVGERLGTDLPSVMTALTGAGYDVVELERDGSELEATILVEGEKYEVEISAETGMVLEIELYDADDHDDDHNDDEDRDD